MSFCKLCHTLRVSATVTGSMIPVEKSRPRSGCCRWCAMAESASLVIHSRRPPSPYSPGAQLTISAHFIRLPTHWLWHLWQIIIPKHINANRLASTCRFQIRGFGPNDVVSSSAVQVPQSSLRSSPSGHDQPIAFHVFARKCSSCRHAYRHGCGKRLSPAERSYSRVLKLDAISTDETKCKIELSTHQSDYTASHNLAL
jgi:hypothetical protein